MSAVVDVEVMAWGSDIELYYHHLNGLDGDTLDAMHRTAQDRGWQPCKKQELCPCQEPCSWFLRAAKEAARIRAEADA